MAARIYRLRPVQGMLSLNPTVCCQAGSAQAVQQASVHSSEGGTEKLLALTVCLMAARISRLRPVQGMLSLNPTVCCQAGSAQAVQQASIHSSEGGTEKLLALTVSVSWQRV